MPAHSTSRRLRRRPLSIFAKRVAEMQTGGRTDDPRYHHRMTRHEQGENGTSGGRGRAGVLLYNCRTENLWGINGDKINILPTTSPHPCHILPTPHILPTFPPNIPNKLSTTQHILFNNPTVKSTLYQPITMDPRQKVMVDRMWVEG